MEQDNKSWQEKMVQEMNMEELQQANFYTVRTADKLMTAYLGCVERIIKSLFLINAGGVVTILTYLHQSDISYNVKKLLDKSLKAFLAGLFFALVLVSIDYFLMLTRVNKFNGDIENFREGKILFSKIIKSQSKKDWIWVVGFGAFSFVCLIAGIIFGLMGYC